MTNYCKVSSVVNLGDYKTATCGHCGQPISLKLMSNSPGYHPSCAALGQPDKVAKVMKTQRGEN